MPQPKVSIIGAGITGLVLGRALLKHGISAILYERDALQPRHSYGISLTKDGYRDLLPILELDENAFKRKVAVDAAIGGVGKDSDSRSFRANRMKFEELLRDGLNVKWEHKLKSVEFTAEGIALGFENGEHAKTDILIGADGVHSQVRKIISPSTEFEILPFAVFNGKRRMKPNSFDRRYSSDLAGDHKWTQLQGDTYLELSTNEATLDKTSYSYTFSRPARGSDDPLYRPKRPISGAEDIPEEFFTEVNELQGLKPHLAAIFEPDLMKKDRLLNWLMRSVLVPKNDLQEAAEKKVVLLGDSGHHGPIIASEGANLGIIDAIALAETIFKGQELASFNERRYDGWKDAVESGVKRLEDMHSNSKSTSVL